ncbi:MAG: type I methionyl aminopeptidase [Candidatus Coatesbacteria bacterium]|nr:type I methionyl aminopeptidase [Candidatus Coatesbacteria bacterium]
MIDLKSAREMDKIERSCQICADVLHKLRHAAVPGITTKELDTMAEGLILKEGATPSFKGYSLGNLPPFPGSITTSINEEIVHGIPSGRKLKSGDLLKIDIGVLIDGFHGDTAISVLVGTPTAAAQKLHDVTKMSLRIAIDLARPGNRIGDIGFAIQDYVEHYGYSPVRDFVGHGLGRSLHEDPQVPHYGKKGQGTPILEGMVFCVEPMINEGTYKIKVKRDRWTAVTADGRLSAQFEHAIAVTADGPRILSLHESDREFYSI